MMVEIRKVLCIDGGGIKGVFPAAFLSVLEEDLERPIGEYFDLIMGTSTGGILAAGLALGHSAAELSSFYFTQGAAIFPTKSFVSHVSRLGRPKYDPKPLRNALTDVFGEKKLGDCQTRVVIPSLNLETGDVHVYKTSHNQRLMRDYKERIVDVCMATAAAPTYFPAYSGQTGLPLVDGGMWANNPTGAAVVEAIGVLGWRAADLRVLSLGCTREPLDAKPRSPLRSGYFHWARGLVSTFMAGQSSASLGTAQLLVGRENVFRYDPFLPAGRYRLDKVSGLESLSGLGRSEARTAIPHLGDFFTAVAPPFEPYHRLKPESS